MRIAIAAAALMTAFGVTLSLVHPWGNPHAADGAKPLILPGVDVPPDVRQAVGNACADCHSNATRWPLYAHIAPVSWLLERDVMEARKRMNLSTWQDLDNETRISMLAETAAEVRRKEMPPKQYVLLHPDARLTDAERTAIINWTKAERARLRAEQAKNMGSEGTTK
jgi:cytochrome c